MAITCQHIVKRGMPTRGNSLGYPLTCDRPVRWHRVNGRNVYDKYCDLHKKDHPEINIPKSNTQIIADALVAFGKWSETEDDVREPGFDIRVFSSYGNQKAYMVTALEDNPSMVGVLITDLTTQGKVLMVVSIWTQEEINLSLHHPDSPLVNPAYRVPGEPE